MKARVFIGSSTEGLEIANAIQHQLDHDAHCTIWTQGVFGAGGIVLQKLVEATRENDFAILIFSPDDAVTIRGSDKMAPRDNVIFETGLFVGRHGSCDRIFLVVPRNFPNLQIPTDLLGIVQVTYDTSHAEQNLLSAVGAACTAIRAQLKKLSRPLLTARGELVAQ